MKCALVLVLAVLFLLSIKDTQAQNYGIAVFNIRGITGHIRFTPFPNNSMAIKVNISGTRAEHSWHVHLLPVDGSLPPIERCNNNNIGGHFDPLGAKALHGSNYGTYCNLNNQTACEVGDLSGKVGVLRAGIANYIDTTGDLTLFGRNGIVGRSIKIHGMEDACATIISSNEMSGRSVVMLQASFTYPVGGVVYMRQVMGEGTVIFGKLYWTNNSPTTNNHNWHIHLNNPGEQYREGNCRSIGGHYNPYNVNVSSPEYAMYCNSNNLTQCEVGDLSGKHGRITLPLNPAPLFQYSFLFHDNFLNLTGIREVVGRSLAIHSNIGNRGVIACAPLVQVETLMISTNSGSFRASQYSRFAPTSVVTSYEASGLTIFNSAIAPNSLCRNSFSARSSRVYNPHEAPPRDGSDDTPDRYPVGDFLRKYRMRSLDRVSELPVHGVETIAGHTLGYNESLSRGRMRYTCSSLWPSYPTGSNVRMAKATFNNTVTGAIYFIQRNIGNGVFGATYVFVDIWYTNSSRTTTMGHKWHIHERPPLSNGSCSSIRGHFNPFNVDISGNYTSKCSRNSPLRCESGDLSGKHPKLNISANTNVNRETYTFTDSNLHLWGPANYSIIGRSVGLHLPAAQGGAIFDCGAITEVVGSSRLLNLTFPYDSNFNRARFQRQLIRRIPRGSPSNLLMLRQVMTQNEGGNVDQVTMSVRVLGSSAQEVEDQEMLVQSEFNTMYPSSGVVLMPASLLLLILSVVFAFMGVF